MTQIILLLQLALSLLSNPQVQADPQMLAQANALAGQAIVIAEGLTANLAAEAQSAPVQAPVGTVSAPAPAPERQRQVIEEAQLDFGSGPVRPVDAQSNQPTYLGGAINGRLTLKCGYVSHLDGQPDSCDAQPGDEAGLPGIASTTVTIEVSGRTTAWSEDKTTDQSGAFSFSMTDSCDAQYGVAIRSGSYRLATFAVTNGKQACATSTQATSTSQ